MFRQNERWALNMSQLSPLDDLLSAGNTRRLQGVAAYHPFVSMLKIQCTASCWQNVAGSFGCPNTLNSAEDDCLYRYFLDYEPLLPLQRSGFTAHLSQFLQQSKVGVFRVHGHVIPETQQHKLSKSPSQFFSHIVNTPP
jgi:hypothetical protein